MGAFGQPIAHRSNHRSATVVWFGRPLPWSLAPLHWTYNHPMFRSRSAFGVRCSMLQFLDLACSGRVCICGLSCSDRLETVASRSVVCAPPSYRGTPEIQTVDTRHSDRITAEAANGDETCQPKGPTQPFDEAEACVH